MGLLDAKIKVELEEGEEIFDDTPARYLMWRKLPGLLVLTDKRLLWKNGDPGLVSSLLGRGDLTIPIAGIVSSRTKGPWVLVETGTGEFRFHVGETWLWFPADRPHKVALEWSTKINEVVRRDQTQVRGK